MRIDWRKIIHGPPRLVCTCGEFRDSGVRDEVFYGYKCACGGWMGAKRLLEQAYAERRRARSGAP